MLIYEVNLTVEASAAGKMEEWLLGHVEELLKIRGFKGAEYFVVQETKPGFVNWSMRYEMSDKAALEEYLSKHAPAMREDGETRFGGQFITSRRVLTLRRKW